MFPSKLKIFLTKPSLNPSLLLKIIMYSFFGQCQQKSWYWLDLLFFFFFKPSLHHFNLLQSLFHSHQSFTSLKLYLPKSILSPPYCQSQPDVLDKFDLSFFHIWHYCPYLHFILFYFVFKILFYFIIK